MKFACDACQAQYMIADEKVRDRAVKVKCKKCDHVIVVRPPKPDEEAPRERTIDGALSAPTEESARLPSMEHDENEIDSDETHVLDADEARSAAAAFGEFDVDDPPVAAAHADATHVALNPLAGLASEDFRSPERDDLPHSDVAPPTDLIATTQGAAFDDDDDAKMPEENLSTVVSGPGVFDDSHAVGGSLAVGDRDDDELSPFASGSDDAFSSNLDENLGDDLSAGGSFSDESLDAGLGDLDAMGDVPAPPSDGDLEAALSQEGAPVSDDNAFSEPAFADPGLMDPQFETPAFDDETGKSVGHYDPTVAGPSAGLDVPSPAPAHLASEEDPEDEEPIAEPPPVDELDQVLSATFNNMFSDPGSLPFPEADDDIASDPGHRDPTSVIDASQMQALRRQTQPSDSMYRDDSAFDDLQDQDEEPEWHVAIDDEDVGPLSLADVRDEVQRGRVQRDSLVWKVGMDDWYPAEDIPEIADLFAAGRSGGGVAAPNLSGFDVGEPLDDMGPSPFGGPENSDPFGQVHDLHDPDPSWQPHGLTDVYQAANLAEAGASAPPPPSLQLPVDDESEGGWRPGAASALSALVANEIDRIETSSQSSGADGPLLPADDALQSDPLDGTGPSLLSEIAGGSELSGGMMVSPLGGELGPALDAGPALAPYGMAPGAPPYPPAAVAPPAGRSNLIIGVMALAALFIVTVGILGIVFIISMNNSGPQVAQGPTTVVPPPVNPAVAPANAVVPAETASANTEASTTGTAAVAPTAEPPPPATDEKKPDQVAMVVPKSNPTPKPDVVEKDKDDEVKENSSPRSSRRSRRPRAESKPDPKFEPKKTEPPPPSTPRRPKDCDPVLDFDCDEKKSPAASKRKTTLSKTDILSTVKKKIRTIDACGTKHGVQGSVKMRWQIEKNGSTSKVTTLTSKYKGKPVGDCLESAIRKWKFPAYTGSSPGNIDFPFKLK